MKTKSLLNILDELASKHPETILSLDFFTSPTPCKEVGVIINEISPTFKRYISGVVLAEYRLIRGEYDVWVVAQIKGG